MLNKNEDLAASLKVAMRRMPGPVSLVTTQDRETGAPAGLAVSAVIPVSMEPPSMLVAINQSGSAHAFIKGAGRFCINLLDSSQTAVVQPFADPARRAERFAADCWDYREGVPFVKEALANIFCEVSQTLCHGTHEIFVGDVVAIVANHKDQPLGWIEGNFAVMRALA